jgi:hypothetical protein
MVEFVGHLLWRDQGAAVTPTTALSFSMSHVPGARPSAASRSASGTPSEVTAMPSITWGGSGRLFECSLIRRRALFGSGGAYFIAHLLGARGEVRDPPRRLPRRARSRGSCCQRR